MSLAHELVGVKQPQKGVRFKQPPPPTPKRPENVSREVYLLTGQATPPSLMSKPPSVALKSKPKQQVKWNWTPFQNSARQDGLTLNHYAKVGDPQEDYVFARFNRKIQLVKYTEDEYREVLSKLEPLEPASNNLPIASSGFDASTNAKKKKASQIYNVSPQRSWTKKETDTLFELCEQFDLRFAVIHDRWPEEEFGSRNVDELKDRYYSVAKCLLDYRLKKIPKYMESLSLIMYKHCQAISVNPYDYEYERIRKNQLQTQYVRSKTELREEEEIVRDRKSVV